MLKVLLVDDEPFILQGMEMLIDWEEQGFEIAGSASNGLEALKFIRHSQADLIIADIKMPEMSGLDLLETVRREKITDAYFAILSGYNDFEYARRAIGNACVDYILKPVQKEELYHLLERVRVMHADEQKRRYESSRQEKAYFARNLISVLCGKYDSTNLEYVKERLELSGGIRYIDIEIDARENASCAADEEKKRQLQRKLYEVCLGILGDRGYQCIFDVSRNENRYDIGLLYCDGMAEEAGMQEQEYLDYFLEKIRKAMNAPVVMLVGKQVDCIEKLSESYRTAAVARSFQDFSFSRFPEETAGGEILCKQSCDALVSAVEQNDKAGISGCVARIYEEINNSGMEAGLVGLNINYLLFGLVHLAAQLDENINQEEILRFISTNAFEEGTMRGSRLHLVRFAGEYADYLAQLRGKSARGVLGEIEKEVRDNYAGNLTLKELSKKYFINTAYLGQIFRKKYGCSFKDYLNAYRMDRAAELLLHTDMKIYEVAERVGYHDLDYFINRFIEAKGCTPARFRKQTRE